MPFVGYEATRSWLRAHGLLEERPLAAALLGGAVGGAMRGCLETPAPPATRKIGDASVFKTDSLPSEPAAIQGAGVVLVFGGACGVARLLVGVLMCCTA